MVGELILASALENAIFMTGWRIQLTVVRSVTPNSKNRQKRPKKSLILWPWVPKTLSRIRLCQGQALAPAAWAMAPAAWALAPAAWAQDSKKGKNAPKKSFSSYTSDRGCEKRFSIPACCTEKRVFPTTGRKTCFVPRCLVFFLALGLVASKNNHRGTK